MWVVKTGTPTRAVVKTTMAANASIRQDLDNIGCFESQIPVIKDPSPASHNNLAILTHKHFINRSSVLEDQLHAAWSGGRFAPWVRFGKLRIWKVRLHD